MLTETSRITPLYQLNVMLFLAWPSPPSFVKPIFYTEGFEVLAIEPPLTVPLVLRTRAIAQGIDIQVSSRPDLLLWRQTTADFLVLECKVRSFSADSPRAKQIRTFLIISGNDVRDAVGQPPTDSWQSHLLTAVGGELPLMQEMLLDISDSLTAAGFEAMPNGAIDMQERTDGLYLTTDERGSYVVEALATALPEGVRVISAEGGWVPRVLYLLPLLDATAPEEEHGRQVIQARLRAALTAAIGREVRHAEFRLDLDDLMRSVTPVWDLIENRPVKQSLRQRARAYVRAVLRQLQSVADIQFEPTEIGFTVRGITPDMRSTIRQYLQSAAYRRGKLISVEGIQLGFEDLIPERWG
jgi:hypothetical protein